MVDVDAKLHKIQLAEFRKFRKTLYIKKHVFKSSCIDLIITKCLKSFHNTYVLNTDLSDFHKLT